MALTCPDCRRGTLVVSASLEVPRDSRSDEITLQIVECAACGFAAPAVYEESRRGNFDSGSVDHRAYRASHETVQALRSAIARCPSPRNASCSCDTHATLGEKNASGRWVGLQRFDLGSRVSIEYWRD